MDQRIIRGIKDSLAVKRAVLESCELVEAIATLSSALAGTLRGGRKVFFFGNGGSAADAQHLAAEFAGRYLRERPGLPALALTTNASCLTAIANDYGYDFVFAPQLQAMGSRGDIAVGISTSGNSPSVLRAVEAAREMRMITVGMTAAGGGKLKPLVHHCLCIPSERTPRIQEAHILIGHILCEVVEEELFGNGLAS